MAKQQPSRPEQGPEAAHRRAPGGSKIDLVCFSHLRWDFVYQRPQHLLSRAARGRRVFFVEEPKTHNGTPKLEITHEEGQPWVAVPYLPAGLEAEVRDHMLARLVDGLLAQHGINDYAAWYYTPYALRHTGHLAPRVTVYDCMDELSLFKGANPVLRQLEKDLFARADLVFTGGQSLYEAKRDEHPDVHLFPSSIDRAHFGQARAAAAEPSDQAGIPHPRLGFFGVVDERMDLALVDGIAAARPDWQIVIIGPVAKIDAESLPRRPNLHYLGGKSYKDLPAYLAGWDVALMPFAHNEATRFISPTKTPEYLAGGKPVVSTSIRDVVRPYGQLGLVGIADSVPDFVAAIEAALNEGTDARQTWLRTVDGFLQQNSWDLTWSRMEALIEAAARPAAHLRHKAYQGS